MAAQIWRLVNRRIRLIEVRISDVLPYFHTSCMQYVIIIIVPAEIIVAVTLQPCFEDPLPYMETSGSPASFLLARLCWILNPHI